MDLYRQTSAQSLGRGGREGGFALVVTLSLMVLLTVVGFGLLTLSVIQLRTAGLDRHRQQARDNARLALLMAIGELQKEVGPDRRVTATAGVMSADGIGAADADLDKQRYVGVFDTEKSLGSVKWEDRREGSFRRWLVSGGEAEVEELAWAGNALSGETVTVLGPGSVGTGNPDLEVRAPTTAVRDGGGNPTGGYSWWVSDSGMKASMRLVKNGTPDLGHLAPERFGIAEVEGMDWFPGGGDESSEGVERLVTLASAGLLAPEAEDAVAAGFHWLTSRHDGVLADTRRGGLRRDLSVALAGGRGEMEKWLGERMFEPVTGKDPGGPYWEQVRQFYQSGGTSALEVEPQTKDQMGVYPVVAGFVEIYGMANTVGYMPTTVPHPNQGTLYPSFYNKRRNGNNVYGMTMFMTPVIKLWNPYNRPIQASGGMTLAVGNGNKQYGETADDSYEDVIWWGRNGGHAHGIDARPPKTMRYEHRYFLPAMTFSPGEVKVFSLRKNTFLDLDGTYKPYSGKPLGEKTEVVKEGWILGELEEGGFTGHGFWDVLFTKRDIPDSDRGTLNWGGGRSIGGHGGKDPGDIQVLDSERPGGLGFDVDPHSFSTWNLKLFAGRVTLDQQGYGSAYRPLVNLRNISTDATGFEKANTLFTTIDDPTSTPVFSRPDFQDSIWARRAVLRMVLNEGDEDARLYNQVNHRTKDVKWLATHNPRSPTVGCWPFEHRKAQVDRNMFTGSRTPMRVNGKMIRSRDYGIGTAANYLSGMLPELTSPDALFMNEFIGFSDIGGPERCILFDFPRHSQPENYFLSLGQLHHANLWIEDGDYTVALEQGHGDEDWFSDNLHPAYPIGNSWADPRLKFEDDAGRHKQLEIVEGEFTYNSVHYDLSWYLNENLWDGYFFSASSPSDRAHSNNPRLAVRSGRELTDGEEGVMENAARLMVSGAFNVNSTSVEAWEAFLASLSGKKVRGRDPRGVPFARFEEPRGGEVDPGTLIEENENYDGFRGLSGEEIDELAERVVEQVRLRGPFHSLADFVNRAAFEGAPEELRMKGALQAAIDETLINANHRAGGEFVIDSRDVGGIYEKEAYAGDVAAAVPGYLTQGDLLARLGPLMSVRSDTFVVRAYGEAVDASGRVLARAMCEATVQRMPEFVDPSLDPAMDGEEIKDGSLAARFGRRLVMTGFRWLGADA